MAVERDGTPIADKCLPTGTLPSKAQTLAIAVRRASWNVTVRATHYLDALALRARKPCISDVAIAPAIHAEAIAGAVLRAATELRKECRTLTGSTRPAMVTNALPRAVC